MNVSYDPHAKLDEYYEGMIALGLIGGPFTAYAASQLASYADRFPNWEIKYWCIHSALARKDRDAVRVYVNDWRRYKARPSARVSKFIPGEHFHCLSKKFDSLDAAKDYLEERGYSYAGLEEKFVYDKQGG